MDAGEYIRAVSEMTDFLLKARAGASAHIATDSPAYPPFSADEREVGDSSQWRGRGNLGLRKLVFL